MAIIRIRKNEFKMNIEFSDDVINNLINNIISLLSSLKKTDKKTFTDSKNSNKMIDYK